MRAETKRSEPRRELGPFQVGLHVLELSRSADRWTVTVDGMPSEGWYTSGAEAWAAGVREADRLERPGCGSPGPPGRPSP